jgi:hypothetical protein
MQKRHSIGAVWYQPLRFRSRAATLAGSYIVRVPASLNKCRVKDRSFVEKEIQDEALFRSHFSTVLCSHRDRDGVGWSLCVLAALGSGKDRENQFRPRLHNYSAALGHNGRIDGRLHDHRCVSQGLAETDSYLQFIW